MRIHSPSLHELHAFAAAARHGSFSKAAEQLCVTQGAISRALRKLEEELGQTLFVRQARGAELTTAGREYLAQIEPALQSLEAAALAQRAPLAPTRLRLSVAPTLASQWLIPRLPDWQARHPQIALALVPYQREEDFGAAEVDAWLRPAEAHWPNGIVADYIVGRAIVPICRPQDIAAEPPLREPADLLARPLLFHTHYPDHWRAWLAAVGVEPERLDTLAASADFEQVAMLVQGVLAGLGVAVVQRCLIDDELASGRIVIPFARPVEVGGGYMLCTRRAAQSSRALRQLREWLLEQGAAAD
ncbi:LysR substrate-binding domain-containing protein [Roseateles violae]|uniref:LysR substrate-binding domain-containing protein n=1 Tax=Roseateles violae TaxID=3058042 RepID=A0ABT8DYC1_9BURK|nr:LysR substrate-binding domain-containing protein [Pelomonas sp. PFR6]MDN3922472.1 LysR substrate-binding domain-containing protein [Pelomonas sp. PFR6]